MRGRGVRVALPEGEPRFPIHSRQVRRAPEAQCGVRGARAECFAALMREAPRKIPSGHVPIPRRCVNIHTHPAIDAAIAVAVNRLTRGGLADTKGLRGYLGPHEV